MILNLACDDYANYSHDNARALRSIGIDCIDLVTHPRVNYTYETSSDVCTKEKMIPYIQRADVVQVMHSHTALFDLAKQHCKGQVIIYHTGSRYRDDPEYFNNRFAGHKTVSDQTEFMHLGDHKYIVSPVEFERAPLYNGLKKKIGHYPSNVEVKGTASIIKMLKPFDFDWLFDSHIVPHDEQLQRIAACDIYIELFKPILNGHEYGCFGVSALEAAAMGKIVVTNNLYPNAYKDAYGTCPLTIANTEEQFKYVIDGLLKMNKKMFVDLQKETFEIMRENHSFEATGNKIAQMIYE